MDKNILFATVLVATFSLGYLANDIAGKTNLGFVGVANADVAGMGYRDLRRDRAFKKAVKYIVEQSCYVEGEHIHCY